jgi:hypothetical protein
MNQQDIFSPENTTKRTWFAFKNIGDKTSGTYVKRWHTISRKFGFEQLVHDLLQPDGSIISIGEDIRHEFFNSEMMRISFGQIIGIEFIGTKPSTKGHDMKLKQIYSNVSLVNKEWLQKYKDLKEQGIDITKDNGVIEEDIEDETLAPIPMSGAIPANAIFSPTPASVEIPLSALGGQPFLTDGEKINKIADFARKNLNAVTSDLVKTIVEEKTGLAFITTNLDAILAKLYS